MAAATSATVTTHTFRLPGADAHLSIPDAAHDQKVEGDYDLEMMMLDGYVFSAQDSFSLIHLYFLCLSGAGRLAESDGHKKFCNFVE